MDSFSFANPSTGTSIVIALLENGTSGSVVMQGDGEPKTIYSGVVEEARRIYEREKQAYAERTKAGV